VKLHCAILNCITNFTFLRGASHGEKLVERAAKLGYSAIAITDECSVSGVVRAHVQAKELNFKLIVGAEFVLQDAPGIHRVVILAKGRHGYGDLCELITLARSRAPKGEYRLSVHDLASLTDCIAIIAPDPLHASAQASAAAIAKYFPSACWLGSTREFGPDDEAYFEACEELAAACQLNIAACERVLFATRDERPLQDVLTAVRLRTEVSKIGNSGLMHSENFIRSARQMLQSYPIEQIIETAVIAKLCNFSLDELRYEYPREVVPEGETPAAYLRRLTYEGGELRYPNGMPDKVRSIIEHELSIISDLMYEPYFLTIYDIVRFARERGILCQGRGSAANSAVCYCLMITEVDPGTMSVLFERFISRERNEPPDIDVDFEHERREEVMQYLYNKYGRDRTALTAAVSTYRPKGAIRDVGKALGFSLSQVEALSKTITWWDGRTIAAERMVEAGFDPSSRRIQMLLHLTHALIGYPRHLSQHSGGFVIARDKLTRLVPVENAAMVDRTVIQWDKDDLDALGLLKVDVLALGMLTAIRKTLDLIGVAKGAEFRMQDVPREDPATYAMIQKADTVGVFQIESRAQMSMLPRLKPKCFYDLVIEVAIVRPGPIQGGMVHPYLRRRNEQEPEDYPSDAVEAVLKRTLGVPIFQEQVMQLAMVAAGFTAGQADKLRRAMAAWKRKGGLEKFREPLLKGMTERGYTDDFADRLYKQMQGFAEYGFPESHAASFALLVYISCWLKCHHPAAFTCGLLNSQPLGFYTPNQLVQDVKRHGVNVLPVDVSVSNVDSALTGSRDRPDIRLGLRMVAHLGSDAAQRIVDARKDAPFADIADLQRRAQLSAQHVQALASADAFCTLAGHRRNAVWEALGVGSDTALFEAPPENSKAIIAEPTEAENIFADYATVGLTLRRHPLALLRPALSAKRIKSAEEVNNARNGQIIRTTGLVTCRQRPSTAKGTTFVTLEDETGNVNVVVWSRLAESQRKPLILSKMLCVSGRVERQGDVVHLIAGRLIDQSEMLGALNTPSRDFH